MLDVKARNSLQASRIKTKKGVSRISEVVDDSLQALVIKYKEEYKSSDSFIQSIQLVPDPVVVLFKKVQLDDIQKFCACKEGKASILGIDVTFNLGKFYVTFCSYQHYQVVNERGKPPVMIGPAMLHSNKTERNFCYFISRDYEKDSTFGY